VGKGTGVFVEEEIMVRVREQWAVGMAIGIVAVGLVGRPALGREVKLAIHPQKVSAEAGKYALLPPAASLTEADAVSWYDKAVRALPDKTGDKQIQAWLKMPIEQLPTEQAEEALAAYVEGFKCVAQAVKCRDCNWPVWQPGTQVANLDEYRRLAFAIRLWARLELSNGEYEGALLALRMGFGMARQLGQGPTLIQLQVAVAAAAMMSGEVEELVQGADAPNLYAALTGLPKPLVNVEKAIESERKAAFAQFSGKLSSSQLESQMKLVHERTRVIVKRLDGDLALLQCIEALRAHAASHDGQLPQMLAEITEIPVPLDPLCGAAFRYTRTGPTATLASTVPVGGQKTDETQYEITVKN